MLAGEMYNALDSQLIEEKHRARDLIRELNNSKAEDHEHRERLINHLFASVGRW